jgi:hypothetical protein
MGLKDGHMVLPVEKLGRCGFEKIDIVGKINQEAWRLQRVVLKESFMDDVNIFDQRR